MEEEKKYIKPFWWWTPERKSREKTWPGGSRMRLMLMSITSSSSYVSILCVVVRLSHLKGFLALTRIHFLCICIIYPFIYIRTLPTDSLCTVSIFLYHTHVMEFFFYQSFIISLNLNVRNAFCPNYDADLSIHCSSKWSILNKWAKNWNRFLISLRHKGMKLVFTVSFEEGCGGWEEFKTFNLSVTYELRNLIEGIFGWLILKGVPHKF